MKSRIIISVAIFLPILAFCIFEMQGTKPPSNETDIPKDFNISATNTLEVLHEKYQRQENEIEAVETGLDLLRKKYKITDISPGQLQPTNSISNGQSYWNEKQKLAKMIQLHKLLNAEIEQKKIDAQFSKNAKH